MLGNSYGLILDPRAVQDLSPRAPGEHGAGRGQERDGLSDAGLVTVLTQKQRARVSGQQCKL